MEMVCLIALGGSLNTIGGSTGLGSNLADVQDNAFQSLVNQDCKKISNAMSEIVVRRCAERLGYASVDCKFEFVEADEFEAKDYIELAEKLHSMGVKIDSKKLKELTKLDFIDDGGATWTPGGEETKE